MDLIYTNAAGEDIGVLHDYEFDLAFGADENNFECTILSKNHCMEAGSFLYIEGTEYGGIVDGMEVDTAQGTVKYKGRTWHGILAGNIIEPEPGYDYYVAKGEANVVLAELIAYLDLTMIFTASTETSGIQIGSYSFHRYTDAYTGIRKMLAEFSAKLKIAYQGNTVILSAVPLVDYSQEMEFEDSQVDFNVAKNFRPVNHLVCLGGGSLRNRFVIHLFTDENGGVQPYKTTENPVSDADYILDKRGQLLFGTQEVAAVYDYSSAQTTENFIMLSNQPDDWATDYAKYFRLDENDSYVNAEGVPYQDATLLTAQPGDWADRYGNYYFYQGGRYRAVEAETDISYSLQTARPVDWETNYVNYYFVWTDGINSEHRKVNSDTAFRYVALTQEPTDWRTNWRNYYIYMYEFGYMPLGDAASQLSADLQALLNIYGWPFAAKSYYVKQAYEVAPKWEAETYYTQYVDTHAPDWEANKFYSVVDTVVKPPFAKNTFFEKKLDHFADMVAGGLEILKNSYNCDSISIDLDLEGVYDIGDIVGATETVTGLSVWQPISKKIVTIKNGQITISYKVGE
jgi:hypothetical protein